MNGYEYSVSSTVDELVQIARKQAEDKGLDYKVSVKQELPSLLYGNAEEWKQGVLDILTSAIEHTEQGIVTMSVNFDRIDDESIILKIRIADTGKGEKQENLQMPENCHLEISSVSGKGTIYSLSLEQKVIRWEKISESQAAGIQAPNARVLVVDDTPVNMTMFCGLLKATQIRIETAASGAQCLALAAKGRYHIIFIDHLMPEMDGIETLHHLQEDEDSLNAGVPMIALTANASADARQMYIEEGFTDYLSKPVDKPALLQMLQQYLPNELIISTAKTEQNDNGHLPQTDQKTELIEQIQKIAGIDTAAGIAACGTEDIYLSVVKEFYPVAEKQAGQIEEYCRAGDYRNYTIQVHSLKSSARLIGALELSEQAKKLEACGNAEDETTIAGETPELLAAYRIYADKLRPLFEHPEEEAAKPLIEDKMLKEILEALCEVVEAFDFDSADSIMETFQKYRMPEAFQESYQKLKTAMAEVARDDIIEMIHNYLGREEH